MIRLLAALLIVTPLMDGCSSLPPLQGRAESTMTLDTDATRLGRAAVPLSRAHPMQSGVFALLDGHDAFAARLALADAADRSLDVQYYIWHADVSGLLLLDALRRAADRGVRVRMLLDDNNTSGLDSVWAAFSAHKNVEVRLFNPFAMRRWRVLGFASDFGRLNRRMHNKSFTADDQATIVGGRNVGDSYFSAGNDLLFVDLDVLAIGKIVGEVSTDFDRYWNSESSYPVESLLPAADSAAIEKFDATMARMSRDPATIAYAGAVSRSPLAEEILSRRVPLDWTLAHLVSDDPSKGLDEATEDELLWSRLKRILGRPKMEMKLASAYLVLGKNGTDYFAAMAADGVKISILTNSLESTDVPAVHAGYAKRRVALLKAGITLFEMKRGAPRERGGASLLGSGSSTSSLHAKTFTVDAAHIFIGSFNFDQRSARLNTEMGFVIDSPELTQWMAATFERHFDEETYRVRLDEAGHLQWIEHVGGKEIVHSREPGSTFWNRLGLGILSILPIEWLL